MIFWKIGTAEHKMVKRQRREIDMGLTGRRFVFISVPAFLLSKQL